MLCLDGKSETQLTKPPFAKAFQERMRAVSPLSETQGNLRRLTSLCLPHAEPSLLLMIEFQWKPDQSMP